MALTNAEKQRRYRKRVYARFYIESALVCGIESQLISALSWALLFHLEAK